MRTVAMTIAGAAVCALVVTTAPRPASADILVSVSKSTQRMSVLVDGTARYNWKVTTGSKRHTTPTGVFKPQWMVRKWKSRKYNNAPMPNSIFFHGGYAIHGTTEIARLGRIGSHGCVRLHPDNAKRLYSLVEKQMASTRVVVSDDMIMPPTEAPKKKPGQFMAESKVNDSLPAGSALEALALAPEAAATPKAQPSAKKAEVRRVAKAKPTRTARTHRPGFHW